jgi:hypothetical protein
LWGGAHGCGDVRSPAVDYSRKRSVGDFLFSIVQIAILCYNTIWSGYIREKEKKHGQEGQVVSEAKKANLSGANRNDGSLRRNEATTPHEAAKHQDPYTLVYGFILS